MNTSLDPDFKIKEITIDNRELIRKYQTQEVPLTGQVNSTN